MLELNKVYNMDCMEGMKDIPDNYFELAIVDPPYGIGRFNHDGKHGRAVKWEYDWNNDIPSPGYFEELKRVSREQIIWGANYYNCFSPGGAIVWYKDTHHPNISKCEIASYSAQRKVDYVRVDWSNTDKYNKLRSTDIHPCQKPVQLYSWLLQHYAKPGDKILDTHVGSGSSIIACLDMGFDYMGFEIDADYFKAMQDRIYHFTRQMPLDGI